MVIIGHGRHNHEDMPAEFHCQVHLLQAMLRVDIIVGQVDQKDATQLDAPSKILLPQIATAAMSYSAE